MGGTPVEQVPQAGTVRARATTSEPGGLQVLHNGSVRQARDGTWMATRERELVRLWDRIGAEGSVPDVPFDSHVVLAHSFLGGACEPEIVAAEIDEHATLTLERRADGGACIALAVQVGIAVAVPRRMLPAEFVFVPRHRQSPGKQRFALEPRASQTVVVADATLEQERIPARFGEVELPEPGTIALRALNDGREVWVAHHADSRVSVVAADHGPDERVRDVLRWNAERGRFESGHDSMGRSTSGGVPLHAYTFVRLPTGRLAIGPPGRMPPGTVVARDQAPRLVGRDRPYAELEANPEIPEGHMVLVDEALVYGLEGPPRLCAPPEIPKMRAHFLGCPDESPRVADAASERRSGVTIHEGPHVVRRRGDELDYVIRMGGGMSGGVREHRIEDPAPRGDTRERGQVAVGATVEGDTRGGRNGFDVPCVPTPGAPDEAWMVRAPRDMRIAIQVDAEYDVAMALLDESGNLLDCNDDRHGFYRSSIVHADVRAGQTVRVIVDGFGGASGSYALRVLREEPPGNGGVLTLDAPVRGNTTNATDDQSSGCSAPGPDHRYRFEATEAGRYRFVVEAPGWSPLVVLWEELGTSARGCHVGRDATAFETELEPGAYWVFVDGPSEDAKGAYTLRAERL